MRISEVARKLGVSASWLRKLERKGKIPPARRDVVSGQRRYMPEDLDRLRKYLYPDEPPTAPTPPPSDGLVNVTLTRQHSVNGIKYGPGVVRVAPEMAAGFREADDRAARSAV